MHYLQDIKEYMLTYRRSDYLEVIGYSDLDFVRCIDSRKSTIKYIFLVIGSTILWMTAKQDLVIISIMEVEYIAWYETFS